MKKRNTQARRIILEFLRDHIGGKFYLTQISRETGISNSTAHQILEKEVKKGLLKKIKIGNLSFYSFPSVGLAWNRMTLKEKVDWLFEHLIV